VPVTLPVDPSSTPVPAASSPSHRGHSPAGRFVSVQTLVSEQSRSPRRKCVREVLCPVHLAAQGLSPSISRDSRSTACRPQNRLRPPQITTDRPQAADQTCGFRWRESSSARTCRRALVSMSHEGPSPTGTGDAPGRSLFHSGSGGLVTQPPRQSTSKLAFRRTNPRLRAIPHSPGEVRERSSMR
jgi:hypothetical protein